MIVLDASAWIDVLVAGLEIPELEQNEVLVPPHFDVEVLGSIRALAQRGTISADEADVVTARHLRAPFTRDSDLADARYAWSVRERMAFADAWYVGLAVRRNATWVTADQRAGRTARLLGAPVTIV